MCVCMCGHMLRQDHLHLVLAFNEDPKYTINTVVRIMRNGRALCCNDPIWSPQDYMFALACYLMIFDDILC